MGKYYDIIDIWSPLLKIIRKAEATPTNGKTTQYDSVVRAEPLLGLSSKTIENAINFVNQNRPSRTYIGGYQFNKNNLIKWAENSGLTKQDIFNAKNQDNIVLYLILDVRKGHKWFKGEITLEEFMTSISQEWAGLPTGTSEKSYYDGVNGNQANVTRAEVRAALTAVKLKTDTQDIIPVPDITPIPESTNTTPSLMTESQFLEYIDL